VLPIVFDRLHTWSVAPAYKMIKILLLERSKL
jgi:hypothetical protein